MKHILLLGAGFSRNWGGWLASEAFEYLLGHPNIMTNDTLKKILWNKQSHGGFEEALAELQNNAFSNSLHDKDNLKLLESAILDMFNEMNNAFSKIIDWDLQGPNKSIGKSINDFLKKFDAIYTLNQDLLLEYHYIGLSQGYLSDIKIHTNQSNPYSPTHDWAVSKLIPETVFKDIHPNPQPIYKLHGSSNWVDDDGNPLLILGGNKQNAIYKLPILEFYQEQFKNDLCSPNARLMVIGYGFGDQHINELIQSSKESGLKIFNINPDGAEQMRKQNRTRDSGQIPVPSELEPLFQDMIMGASRRNLKEIFGGDALEYSKVHRFFNP
jgi:hypothetical protein